MNPVLDRTQLCALLRAGTNDCGLGDFSKLGADCVILAVMDVKALQRDTDLAVVGEG